MESIPKLWTSFKKVLVKFLFSVLRNLKKHQQEQLSSKPQNAVQSSSFWLHNVEENEATEHFQALALKLFYASLHLQSGIIAIKSLKA